MTEVVARCAQERLFPRTMQFYSALQIDGLG
jgi:hypothetical protein